MEEEPPLRPVLILDDNPDDGLFTRRLLLKAGIKNPIITVDCGEQAKAFLRSVGYGVTAPCAVFLDIKMHGEKGFDVPCLGADTTCSLTDFHLYYVRFRRAVG